VVFLPMRSSRISLRKRASGSALRALRSSFSKFRRQVLMMLGMVLGIGVGGTGGGEGGREGDEEGAGEREDEARE